MGLSTRRGVVLVCAAVSIATAACAEPLDGPFPAGTASPAAEVDGVKVIHLGADESRSTPPKAVARALKTATEHAERNARQLGHPYLATEGAVVLTATSPEALDRARRFAKKNQQLSRVPTEYRVVQNSFARLEEVKADLDRLQADHFPGDQGVARVDPQSNHVVLWSSDASRHTLEALRARYGAHIIAVEYVPLPHAYPAR